LKILLVDSGGSGFTTRYTYDVYSTLVEDSKYLVRQASPLHLTANLINNFQPDLLLVMHGTFTPLSLVRYAKTRGAITVLWLVEDPYEIDQHRGEMVNSYDYVFTNEKLAVSEYSRPHVYYLPWCCNPLVHKSMAVSEAYRSDLCFVGMGFRNRVRIINAIAPQIEQLNVKLIGDWHSWGEELRPNLKKFVLPVENDFREVQKYYNGAKLNLNIHRDPVDPPYGNSFNIGAVSPNDRTFALAGCGVSQLVDRGRPALWECFNDGTEIVGFSDPVDLSQKINYYLANPQLREAIGRAAQKKAYGEHLFKHRLTEIFRIIGPATRRNVTMAKVTTGKRRTGPVSASVFGSSSRSFYSTNQASGRR
jgi:spore maturation protein CgeB